MLADKRGLFSSECAKNNSFLSNVFVLEVIGIA